MVRRVDDDCHVVEVVLADEVVVCVLVLVLPERADERRAVRGDPAVEREELINRTQYMLSIHRRRLFIHDTVRVSASVRRPLSERGNSLRHLEALPIVTHAVADKTREYVLPPRRAPYGPAGRSGAGH